MTRIVKSSFFGGGPVTANWQENINTLQWKFSHSKQSSWNLRPTTGWKPVAQFES